VSKPPPVSQPDEDGKAHQVRLRKHGPCPNARHPTPDWHNYPLGEGPEGISLPAGYELTGYLLAKPEVGKRLIVARISRNGVDVPGLFLSSAIVEIDGGRIRTKNSIYRLDSIAG